MAALLAKSNRALAPEKRPDPYPKTAAARFPRKLQAEFFFGAEANRAENSSRSAFPLSRPSPESKMSDSYHKLLNLGTTVLKKFIPPRAYERVRKKRHHRRPVFGNSSKGIRKPMPRSPPPSLRELNFFASASAILVVIDATIFDCWPNRGSSVQLRGMILFRPEDADNLHQVLPRMKAVSGIERMKGFRYPAPGSQVSAS